MKTLEIEVEFPGKNWRKVTVREDAALTRFTQVFFQGDQMIGIGQIGVPANVGGIYDGVSMCPEDFEIMAKSVERQRRRGERV